MAGLLSWFLVSVSCLGFSIGIRRQANPVARADGEQARIDCRAPA
jgi:hypothetical protein